MSDESVRVDESSEPSSAAAHSQSELVEREAMLQTEFIKTIYLGDRACKSIKVDGWEKLVVVQVDEISRIRSESGRWEFYNDEKIVDGLLVSSDARSIQFNPTGPIPNDYISYLEAELIEDDFYRFRLSVSSANDFAQSTEVVVIIEAKGMHLEDLAKPGYEVNGGNSQD